MKKISVCTYCGSPRVFYDAFVGVNDEDNVRIFDDCFCDDCGGECHVNKVEVPDGFDMEEGLYHENRQG